VQGAPEAPSTFKGVSNTKEFNNAVKPAEAGLEGKPPAPSPAPVNPPKP